MSTLKLAAPLVLSLAASSLAMGCAVVTEEDDATGGLESAAISGDVGATAVQFQLGNETKCGGAACRATRPNAVLGLAVEGTKTCLEQHKAQLDSGDYRASTFARGAIVAAGTRIVCVDVDVKDGSDATVTMPFSGVLLSVIDQYGLANPTRATLDDGRVKLTLEGIEHVPFAGPVDYDNVPAAEAGRPATILLEPGASAPSSVRTPYGALSSTFESPAIEFEWYGVDGSSRYAWWDVLRTYRPVVQLAMTAKLGKLRRMRDDGDALVWIYDNGSIYGEQKWGGLTGRFKAVAATAPEGAEPALLERLECAVAKYSAELGGRAFTDCKSTKPVKAPTGPQPK